MLVLVYNNKCIKLRSLGIGWNLAELCCSISNFCDDGRYLIALVGFNFMDEPFVPSIQKCFSKVEVTTMLPDGSMRSTLYPLIFGSERQTLLLAELLHTSINYEPIDSRGT